MTQKLEGSNWTNIQETQLATNVWAYRFLNRNTNKPIYVVWWDYWNEPSAYNKSVSIPVIITGNVFVTEAVPKYSSGSQVTNFATAFNSETKQVSSGQVSLTLGQNPVYV